MDDDTQRLLGEHSAELRSLKETIAKIDANVDKLVASENQREGGKKVTYGIAAGVGVLCSAAVEAIAAKFIR